MTQTRESSIHDQRHVDVMSAITNSREMIRDEVRQLRRKVLHAFAAGLVAASIMAGAVVLIVLHAVRAS
jgi:hypothetical protein